MSQTASEAAREPAQWPRLAWCGHRLDAKESLNCARAIHLQPHNCLAPSSHAYSAAARRHAGTLVVLLVTKRHDERLEPRLQNRWPHLSIAGLDEGKRGRQRRAHARYEGLPLTLFHNGASVALVESGIVPGRISFFSLLLQHLGNCMRSARRCPCTRRPYGPQLRARRWCRHRASAARHGDVTAYNDPRNPHDFPHTRLPSVLVPY